MSRSVASTDRTRSRWARVLPRLVLGFLVLQVAFRLVAITQIPMVADEPDDLDILFADAEGLLDFFDSPRNYELDQSRLPHYTAAPLFYLLGENALVPVRIFFLLAHLGFLAAHFHLARLLCRGTSAPWLYSLLLGASCYLASFSILAMTTGEGLYLMFHALALWLFIRGALRQPHDGEFPHFLLFAVALGLCIASKLWGVFLLGAMILCHLIGYGIPRSLRLRVPRLRDVAMPTGVFLLWIGVLNIVPLPGPFKLAAAGLACLAFLIWLVLAIRGEGRRAGAATTVGVVPFWGLVILLAFSVTLIFSPIYLNLRNIWRMFIWPQYWTSGLIVADSHIYDVPLIVLMKFGFVAAAALVATLVIAVATRRPTPPNGDLPFSTGPAQVPLGPAVLLLSLVFGVHLAIVSLIPHSVTWYPLAIFPLLYLPLALAWDQRPRWRAPWLRLALGVLLAVVVADNSARYARWFPYGHFDGAQYGREYISWNRAGLVSFEIIPDLHEWLTEQDETAGGAEATRVNCQIVYVPMYNEWAAELLKYYFQTKGDEGFEFMAEDPLSSSEADLVLTSPIYSPQMEERLRASGVESAATLGLKGIDIVTIWRVPPANRPGTTEGAAAVPERADHRTL